MELIRWKMLVTFVISFIFHELKLYSTQRHNFFDGGRKIACRKNRHIQISDYIPITGSNIEQCFKCDCPDNFIRCFRYGSTSKCLQQYKPDGTNGRRSNSTARVNIKPVVKFKERLALNSTNVAENRTKTELVKNDSGKKITLDVKPKATNQTGDDVIKLGQITFHLTGAPELRNGSGSDISQPSNDTMHSIVAAEVLGLKPDEFEKKRQQLLEKLRQKSTRSSNNNSTSIVSNIQHVRGPLSLNEPSPLEPYPSNVTNERPFRIILLDVGKRKFSNDSNERYTPHSNNYATGPLTHGIITANSSTWVLEDHNQIIAAFRLDKLNNDTKSNAM